MQKSVYIRTFGCQMNKYDSNVMADRFLSSGYNLSADPENADIILFNTCSVREHAKTRLLGVANSMKPLKKKNSSLIIGICGCVAQQEGSALIELLPHVDIICGTRKFSRIVEIVEEFILTKKPVIETSEKPGKDIASSSSLPEDGAAAFTTVLRGCSNFCSYCVVPYLRGPEASRKLKDILDEAASLAEKNIKEICLLGQNVLAYGKDLKDGSDFASLLEAVDRVEGIERIRFLSSHPRDLTPGIIDRISRLPKVCESLHLPVQAGSDRILKLMGRGYTRGGYLKLIEDIRRAVPGISLTTDIIAGFPSETEDEFKDTLNLLEKICFDDAFLYKYSAREGTRAFSMTEEIPEDEKKARLQRLIFTQKEIAAGKNSPMAGTRVEVLVEGKSKKEPSMVFGKTRTGKNVLFSGGENLKGSLVKVKILKTGPYTLIGEM